ncbi:MAG: hypothetical protein Q8O34_03235 [Rhodocyclaceae bacterium]|nr:hypothetical protein [Rhodocyclaceae bacterium]
MHVIRVLFSGMALLILGVSDAACHAFPGSHGWLFLAGAVYPHLGHMLLGRFDFRRRRGHVIFLFDGLFVGAMISALDLAIVPGAVLATITLFNCMIVGGPTMVAVGIVAMVSGMAAMEPGVAGIMRGPGPGCAASDWLAGAVLIAYFLVVARVIHRLVEEMRQQQVEFQAESDAAVKARSLAERALLAVLPTSAAQVLVEKGEVAPAKVDDATVLLVEFDWSRAGSPSIEDMADAFHVCDTVLARHGFESVKTFGRRMLAMGRNENAPDEAVASAREVCNYFADHRMAAETPAMRLMVRMAIHCGPVTSGLVQPERLNLELLGETIDGLMVLAETVMTMPRPVVVASAKAQHRLRNTAGFVLAPGDDGLPPRYLLTLDAAA